MPFAAGGPLDTLARAIAEPMSADLGQSIIIENVAGAGGSIGVGRVVHAAPDGYTVGVGNWSTHVLNGAIYTLQYNLLDDLLPVALLPSAPQLIVAKSAVPAANFRELVAWLQSNKANVGTAGVGSATHVSGLLFQNIAKSELAFVSYRSAGAALQDLVSGPYRSDVRPSLKFLAPDPGRYDQGLRSNQQVSARCGAGHSDRRRGGIAGLLHFGLEWPMGAQGHRVRYDRQAQRRCREGDGHSSLAEALRRTGPRPPAPDQQAPAALSALQKAEIDKWWPILKAARIKAD